MKSTQLSNSPLLLVDKLVVVGRNKDYKATFNAGLNIIYGDSDTGKSSILNLIDYLLGASEVDMYNELEMNGKYALLEVVLNGKTYTVKRDIFNPRDFIEVYPSTINEMDSVFPREYGPNYSKLGRDGYFSDFLLQALNIPLVRVKEAPTKDVSPMKRVSFRDIWKFCYLSQDDVGNKNLLGNKNGPSYVKTKETFKFVHMLLDSQIQDLNAEIMEKQRRKSQLEQKFNSVSAFFRETQLETTESLDDELETITKDLSGVNVNIRKITDSMTADTEQFEEIRNLIREYEQQVEKTTTQRFSKDVQLENKIRLKKDYQRDIEKLHSSIEMMKRMPQEETLQVDCPICERAMSVEQLKKNLGANSIVALEDELKNLKSRLKSLENLIEEDRADIENIQKRIDGLRSNVSVQKRFVDVETQKYISPYVSQRDALIARQATLEEQRHRVEYFSKLRRELDEQIKEAEALGKQIGKLKENIQAIQDAAPSENAVLEGVTDHLNSFLKFIPIRNAVDISVNPSTFLPVVRNRQYPKLTSGGLRTLVSVGFFISLLRNSVVKDTYLPKFLMIDTVGKYLGKTLSTPADETDEAEDIEEGIKDPLKYTNLYKYFVQFHEKYGKHMQVILVDNDVPSTVEKSLQQFVVKHFNVDGKPGADRGFIDDAD